MSAVLERGNPYPLGARVDARGANFALFSAHGEKVELCLFDPQGRHETNRLALPEYTDGVWHGYLTEARPGLLYGYRVHGPYQPLAGHRFNHHKLLLDPYARDIAGDVVASQALFGFRVGSPRGDLVPDRRDNARFVPKCRLVDESFAWGDDRPPRHPWRDTVIYEAHAGGVTRLHPGIEDRTLRGTITALRAPAMIDHLKRLGITAVELLPVQTAVDERHLLEHGLSNFWGYNTIGFFAPDRRFLGHGGIDEFKRTVAALHAADIEVLLDVVYNHTAEGDHLGPTLCFRGIDNASYYWLDPNDQSRYLDFTGCGNSFRLAHPRVLQLVIDSLRYWVEVMHVDGFRFDLATTLARGLQGYDSACSFLAVLQQDPVLATVKLIAEPWDLGFGGYQVGNFPPGWAEWNDRYRDTVRRFWRGEGGIIGEVAARLAGSADLFGRGGRRPWASINFVTAHDGFTLQDLVSYQTKHNEANHQNNTDGSSENLSWNCGVEGPSEDPGVVALRRRQRRNLLATLLLSQGAPMLLAGDEVANSQSGNNNPYCQDNETGWVDWSRLGRDGDDLSDFIGALVALRRSHGIAREHFLKGGLDPRSGLKDIAWLRPDGTEMTNEDWSFPDAHFLAFLLDGARAPTLVLLNGHHEELDFTMPVLPRIVAWQMRVNTAVPGGIEEGRHAPSASYAVPPGSLILLLGERG